MNNKQLYTAPEIRETVAQGSMSARLWTQKALARAQDFADDRIFITLDDNGALKAADAIDTRLSHGAPPRPLEGVPFVVKDNIAAAAMPFTGGSTALNLPMPTEDPPLVQTLKEAGAVLLGKANLHEFAFGATSENAAFGAVRNPHDPRYSAGGSSGGTAAAVARAIAPIGLGTDTGGSGRIPASFCGCVGFRPSTARYSAEGILPLTWTLDSAATFGTCVDDIMIMDRLLSGVASPPDQVRWAQGDGPRLAVPSAATLEAMDQSVATAFSHVTASLAQCGCDIVDVNLTEIFAFDAAAAFPLAMFEANALWRDLLEREGVSPEALAAEITSRDVADVFRQIFASPVLQQAYKDAMKAVQRLRRAYSQMFMSTKADAIVFPTVPVPPPLLGCGDMLDINGEAHPLFPALVRHTSPGALGALPGISIPAGQLALGLPFGVELDGPAGHDSALLATAAWAEAALKDIA